MMMPLNSLRRMVWWMMLHLYKSQGVVLDSVPLLLIGWFPPLLVVGSVSLLFTHRPQLVVVLYTSIVECLHRYCFSNPGWFIAASAGETQQASTPLLLTPEGTHVIVIPISEPGA